jgi:hypothetical protein
MMSSVRLIGPREEHRGSPRDSSSARRRFSSIIGPEHEAQQQRRGLDLELDEGVADEAEERGHQHVGRRVADRVHADAAEQQDRGIEEAVLHGEQLHPDADQRQVEHHEQEVAHPHAGDHSPEELGLGRHDLRAGLDAVDDHRADHQRHHRVGRDAEREHGMNEVCAAALFADSGAATPSIAPLPKRDGSFATFFSSV